MEVTITAVATAPDEPQEGRRYFVLKGEAQSFAHTCASHGVRAELFRVHIEGPARDVLVHMAKGGPDRHGANVTCRWELQELYSPGALLELEEEIGGPVRAFEVDVLKLEDEADRLEGAQDG